jgi:hypothetical protein
MSLKNINGKLMLPRLEYSPYFYKARRLQLPCKVLQDPFAEACTTEENAVTNVMSFSK